MYRRPILCTLYGAVDFLKVLKIAVVGEGGGCYSMAGKKYWDVMYTLRPSRRSTGTGQFKGSKKSWPPQNVP
jgi:hypothetical protein